MTSKRSELPADFFDGGAKPKKQRKEGDGGNAVVAKPTEAKATKSAGDDAFELFMDSVAPAEEEEKAPADPVESGRNGGLASEAGVSGEGGEGNIAEEVLEDEQLANTGRAAVWRELIEEKKKKKLAGDKGGKMPERPSGEASATSDDSDSDDIGGLTDWRSKGI